GAVMIRGGIADVLSIAGSAGDRVQGSTVMPHRNCIIGTNNSTTSRSAADPGGNGVFGFTQVPDGAGVFGAHNTGGIGVAGLATGVSGNGVSGRSVPPDSDPRAPAGPGAGNGVFGFSTIKG